MSKILRVNMTNLTAKYEDVPEKYKNMGGRWLTSSIVADEVDPTCHPLGPNNKVVFAQGIVTGSAAPTSARISVGGKSPLTGTIKETNAGTGWGQQVARLGIKAIVVEGQPKEKGKLWGLRITKDGAEFFPADEYVGQGLYQVYPQLFDRFGKKADIMSIGVAGEYQMAMAGICFNDHEGQRPSRYAGRGGMGAVLGSKGLKFIVVDSTGVPASIPIADKALFDQGRKKLTEALRTHAVTKPKGALNTYGTAVLINIMNEAGGLPTRNFASGTFEGAAKIAGEAIFEGNKERLGKELYNHACSPGCIIQCSNTWHNPDGSEQVSCQEYESVWAFGANCGIDSLDVTGELIWLCNDYGVDTIEAGGTIAVAMEAGLAEFGDGQGAIQLMKEISKGTPLGHILGNGAAVTGKVFGVVRVPHVKGQNMPAYSPRAVKGIGVTYATSTMGADHTAGYTIAPEILSVGGKLDAMAVEGKAEVSRNLQAATAFLDSTGHCLFIAFAILDIAEGFEGMVEECNGVLGTNWSGEDAGNIGLDILKTERKFNEAAGFTKVHDRLPEFMKYEPLPPHNTVYDVPDEMLDSVYAF
ncbi:MAG: aldehyde ferredoxin oxidoreductase [Chloroflexi bacterium]|nr:aldehyde ferredoxin oxidoreductase [Chloroflexota bacterium]